MQITTVGIDLGKQVFHLIAQDAHGKECWRRKLKRAQLLGRLAQLPACTVVMESCGGAQHWAREVARLGHQPRLLAAQHTRVYVQGNKNDYNDAEALLEAHARPRSRQVALKSLEQQDIQALHRVRQGLVRERTALVNQCRGILMEYGVVLPQGITAFCKQAPGLIAQADNGLTGRVRALLQGQWQWLTQLKARIESLEAELRQIEREEPRAQALSREIPGIGTLTATALVASLGDGSGFANARSVSACIGLVPGQHSTGGKPRLLGISKRGDTYLRTLLIHGARNVVHHAAGKHDPFSQWIQRLQARRGRNIAIVAVANKNARMAWAVLRKLARGEMN